MAALLMLCPKHDIFGDFASCPPDRDVPDIYVCQPWPKLPGERGEKQTFWEARGSEIDAGANDLVQKVHSQGVEPLFVQICRRDSTRDNIHLAASTPGHITSRGKGSYHSPGDALLIRPSVAVDQRLQLLSDPRQHPERTVDERERYGHRLRAHNLVVAALFLPPPHRALELLLLGLGEAAQHQPGYLERVPER